MQGNILKAYSAVAVRSHSKLPGTEVMQSRNVNSTENMFEKISVKKKKRKKGT